MYNGRFEVLEKLGWGHFSTVWKCLDRATGAIVAMKVQKSARHYTEAARDEIELLECAVAAAKKGEEEERKTGGRAPQDGNASHVVQLVDSFEHVGPNGVHICMVFEMLGDNLLTLIKYYNYRGVPVRLVQRLTKDILTGLAFLHTKCKIIHTDLKPENVLLSHRIPQLPKLRKSEWVEFKRKRRAAKSTQASKSGGKSGKSGKNTLQGTSAAASGSVTDSVPSMPEMSKEDKKKLKNKLKKKRQKMKKQQQQQEDAVAVDEDGEVDEAEGQLVAAMKKLDFAETLDVVFASNFHGSEEQNGQEKAADAGCQARDEGDKDWVHLPPEFAARVMIVLPEGRVAGSKKKEIEFTLSVPSNKSGSEQADTSCVLR